MSNARKNPINHIGKINNLLSTQIAKDCVEKVGGSKRLRDTPLADRKTPRPPLVASNQCPAEAGVQLHDIRARLRES
jgi:S-adenosylmethionine synthetase